MIILADEFFDKKNLVFKKEINSVLKTQMITNLGTLIDKGFVLCNILSVEEMPIENENQKAIDYLVNIKLMDNQSHYFQMRAYSPFSAGLSILKIGLYKSDYQQKIFYGVQDQLIIDKKRYQEELKIIIKNLQSKIQMLEVVKQNNTIDEKEIFNPRMIEIRLAENEIPIDLEQIKLKLKEIEEYDSNF